MIQDCTCSTNWPNDLVTINSCDEDYQWMTTWIPHTRLLYGFRLEIQCMSHVDPFYDGLMVLFLKLDNLLWLHWKDWFFCVQWKKEKHKAQEWHEVEFIFGWTIPLIFLFFSHSCTHTVISSTKHALSWLWAVMIRPLLLVFILQGLTLFHLFMFKIQWLSLVRRPAAFNILFGSISIAQPLSLALFLPLPPVSIHACSIHPYCCAP